jgi:glycosyltransferase involved in cell wall biosynthesis
MRILQLISSKGFFGAENMLVNLASELRGRPDLNVVVGVIENMQSPHTEVTDTCAERDIETAKFKCRHKFDFKTIFELRKFIINQKINIVHTHGYKANIYTYLATIGLPVQRVATCHNWINSSLKMNLYGVIDRYILRNAGYVVAVSEDVRKRIELAGIKKEIVKTIDNGISFRQKVSMPDARKAARDAMSIPENAVVIGCVGRISEEKGHEYLLMATQSIIEQYNNLFLMIVGDGPLKDDLERRFSLPRIIFTGFRRDLDNLYPCMDIFVLPSLTEGLPMVLLEAMSWELPVAATRVGQMPMVIEDKKTGMMITPGSSEDIRKKLIHLIENPGLAKKFGKEGRMKVESLYSAERMTDQYINIYQELRRWGR